MKLTDLGFTKKELENKIIDQAVEVLLHGHLVTVDEEAYAPPQDFQKKLETLIEQRIDERIEAIAAAHVLPNIDTLIDEMVFQATNQWGEPKGEALTMKEHLFNAAEKYMLEKVDQAGKAERENSWGSWTGKSSRIAYIVEKHLHHHIERAMQDIVTEGNKILVEGIKETVNLKLAEIQKKLKVNIDR